MFDHHGGVSSEECDILWSASQAQGIIPHNWIHYSTQSYKLSLLSSQLKSFTSQWPGSTLNPQRSIPDCESSGTSPGRIKRARQNTDHWVSPMTKALQEIIRLQWEDATIRSHSVWRRERKKRWWISSNVCTVRLIYLMNASLSFVSETTPSPHVEDHPRGPRRQVQWHCPGFRSSHYLEAAWLDSRSIIVV